MTQHSQLYAASEIAQLSNTAVYGMCVFDTLRNQNLMPIQRVPTLTAGDPVFDFTNRPARRC